MRYDFWATVARVLVTFSAFLGKPMTEEQGEDLARKSFNKAKQSLYNGYQTVCSWLDIAQWTARTVLGLSLFAIAEVIMPKDAQECPQDAPEPQPALPLAEPVQVAQNATETQEMALEDEVPHSRVMGKKRGKYSRVLEPIAGVVYWYKRGKRYVELIHPFRMAA